MREKARRHEGTEARSGAAKRLAPSPRRAFTLTELMVAVAVLIVIVIATSKIFGTASKITGTGQAAKAVMDEAATIERMLRDDIARLTTEGFFAIRSVTVQNNVRRLPPYSDPSAPLLNPNLEPTAVIRADQLVFFTNGIEASNTFRPGSGSNHKGQGTAARVYYGPAFQLLNALSADAAQYPTVSAHDPVHIVNVNANQGYSQALPQPPPPYAAPAAGMTMSPWHWSTGPNAAMVNMARTNFAPVGGGNVFNQTVAGTSPINGNQPDARLWLLVRHNVALMDDDNNLSNDDSKTAYLTDVTTARSIFLGGTPAAPHAILGHSHELRNGRLDAAAMLLNDIRRWIQYSNAFNNPPPATLTPRSWYQPAAPLGDQRATISNAIYYPRAERKAPSANRVDQALTNNVIGSGCSYFAIEWTYEDGVGRVLDAFGNVADPDGLPNSGDEQWGMRIPAGLEQPWFGMTMEPNFRGANPLNSWPANLRPLPIFPLNIERYRAGDQVSGNGPRSLTPSTTEPVTTYEAFFGYNTTQPVNTATVHPVTGIALPWTDPGFLNPAVSPNIPIAYTPFPSAIRVTMILHDPETRLEAGREFQFVIRLPRRVN